MDEQVSIDTGCSGERSPMGPDSVDTTQQVKIALEPLDADDKRVLYVRILAEIEKTRCTGTASDPAIDALNRMLPWESLETLRDQYPMKATNFVVLACKNGQVDILNLLLQLGCPANPDDTDEDGFTALYHALHRNDIVMLKSLLIKWPMWPFLGTRLLVDVAPPDFGTDVHRVCTALRSSAAVLSSEVRRFLEDELKFRCFLYHLSKLANSTLNADDANTLPGNILDAVVNALQVLKNYLETFPVKKGLCHQELYLLFFSLIAENYQKLLKKCKTVSRKAFKEVEVPLTRILMPLMEYRRFGVLDSRLSILKLQMLDDSISYSMAWVELRQHLDKMTAIQKWFQSYRFGVMQQRSVDHLLTMFLDLKNAPPPVAGKIFTASDFSHDPYDMYLLMKDIAALDSIVHYVDLALSVDVRQETPLARVTIERALQVLGEYCKDHEKSPHLTTGRRNDLIKAGLPIERVATLRNVLSHCSAAFALARSSGEPAGEYPCDLLVKVQRDLLKINALISKVLKRMELAQVKLLTSEMQLSEHFEDLTDEQKLPFVELQSCRSVKRQFVLLSELSRAVEGDSRFEDMATMLDNVLFAIRFREMSERIKGQELATGPSLKTIVRKIAQTRQGWAGEGPTSKWFSHNWYSDFESICKSSVSSITYPRGIEEFLQSMTNRKTCKDWSTATYVERATLFDVVVQEIMQGVWVDEKFKKIRKMKFGFKSSVDLQSVLSKLVGLGSEATNRIKLLIVLENARNASGTKLLADLKAMAKEMHSIDDRTTLEMQARQLLDIDDEQMELFVDIFRSACARMESEHGIDKIVDGILQKVLCSAKQLLETGEQNSLVEQMEQHFNAHKIKRAFDVFCDGVRNLPEPEFAKWIAGLAIGGAAAVVEQLKSGYDNRRTCKTLLKRLKNPFDLVWNAISKEMGFDETCKSFQSFTKSLKNTLPTDCDSFLNQVLREELLQCFDRCFYDTLEALRTIVFGPSHADPNTVDSAFEDRLLHLWKCDAKLRASVEMLVMKLMSILLEVTPYDVFCQLETLLRRSLKRSLCRRGGSGIHLSVRNYLAHGDPVAEMLIPEVSTAVALTALVLAKNGRAIVALRDLLGSSQGKTTLKRALCERDASIELQLPTKYASSIEAVLESDYSRDPLWKGDLLDVLEGKTDPDAGVGFDCGFGFLQRATEIELVNAACLDNLDTLTFFLGRSRSVHWTNSERWTLLHFAADKGSVEATQFLLREGADPNATCTGHHTPLHLAVLNGHTEVAGVLLASGADVGIANGNGYTAMHFAAVIGSGSLIGTLAKNGAELESRTKCLKTPMHLAAWNGHSDAVEVLLAGGAEVGAVDYGNLMPLFYAALEGHADVVRLLLDRGCSANGAEIKPISPIHVACMKGHLEVVRLLIDGGADVDLRTAMLATPLQYACCHRRHDVLELLLASGADVDGSTEMGLRTVLHYAAVLGDARAAGMFLERGADVEAVDEDGLTALHFAAEYGHVHVVRMLLEKGANPNATSKRNLAPLHFAVERGHLAAVELLLFGGATVDGVFYDEVAPSFDDGSGRWALQMAMLKGDTDVVRTLLNYGADVNKRRAVYGYASLHYAAWLGHTEVASLLLKKGALVDAVSALGFTPLHCAILRGHGCTVEMLLQNGADVHVVTDENLSAMHFAVEYADVDVVRLLFDRGAKHRCDALGAFPVHFAIINGNLEMLETLLANGVHIDTLAPNNETGLHLACRLTDPRDVASDWLESPYSLPAAARLATVRHLIARGANVDARNIFRMTPLHVSATNGDVPVVELLLRHGADAAATDGWTRTPSQIAAKANHDHCRRLLQQTGEAIRAGNDDGGPSGGATTDTAPVPIGDLERALIDAVRRGSLVLVRKLVANAAAVVDRHRLLHVAATNGDAEIVEELLSSGASVEAMDADGLMPLHVAARMGHVGVVRLLLETGATDVDVPTGGKRRTAAHFAADNDDVDLLVLLVEKGTHLDAVDDDGATPLFVSSKKGFTDVVEALIRRGAGVDAAASGKDAPIHAAVLNVHAPVTRLLLSRAACVNLRGENGRSPLHCCASVGNLEGAALLLDGAADKNATDDSGWTPLHVAARYGDLEFVRWLRRAGASVDGVVRGTETPLHLAAEGGHEAVSRLLLEDGADVDASNARMESPLLLAIPAGHFGVARTLIEMGADVNAPDRRGAVPLTWATREGHAGIVDLLLTNRARVDVASDDGRLPVHWAALDGDVGILQSLLENGADVDCCGKDGRTPLHLAASQGFDNHVQFLLDKKAKVDAVDASGQTALRLACHYGFGDVVRRLLTAGADGNVVAGDGFSPLASAVQDGSLDVVQVLLDHGAATDAVGQANMTLLHMAITKNQPEVVEMLLSNGADVHVRTGEGATYLHYAATFGMHLIVPILLKYGLEADVLMDHDITPLHAAAARGNPNALRALLNNGARIDARNGDGLTALQEAISGRKLEAVQLLLEWGGHDAGPCPDRGASLLHYAAGVCDDRDVVDCLLKHRIEIDGLDSERRTPLHVAAERGRAAVVGTLVENGTSVDATDVSNKTALCLAASGGHLEIVQTLVEAGSGVDSRDDLRRTPLHWAACNGHLHVAVELMRRKADVDALDASRDTPLLLAVLNGHGELVHPLVQNGGATDVRNGDRDVALFVAVRRADLDLVRRLMEDGADAQAVNETNHNALHQAIIQGHVELVRYFLGLKPDLETRLENGATLLHVAACAGRAHVAEVLLERGLDANAVTKHGQTCLHLAVSLGYLDVVQVLLDGGANLGAVDHSGMTALHYAVLESHRSGPLSDDDPEEGCHLSAVPVERRKDEYGRIVQLLVQNGMAVNAVDGTMLAPIHLAAYNGHGDIVGVLLDVDADVGALDDRLYTPLHFAALGGHANTAEMLMNRGGAVDARTMDGFTPLYLASSKGQLEVVSLLLERGASVLCRNDHDTVLHASVGGGRLEVVGSILDRLGSMDSAIEEHLDAPDGDGDTPLMCAAQGGNTAIAELLLMAGSSVNARNDDGATALQCASRNGHELVAQLLRRYGAVGDAVGICPLDCAGEKT